MTRRIAIDGIIFNVEPVGYEILKAYKDATRGLDAKTKQKWEENAAEHLLQQLRNGSNITTAAHLEGINAVSQEIPLANVHKTKNATNRRRHLLQIALGLW